jgi:hypothetical protein
MIAMQVIPDRFDMDAPVGQRAVSTARESKHVRRPTNGIQIKDETFATLRVVIGSGGNLSLIDAGGRNTNLKIGEKQATDLYSNFLMQSVTEERMEKQQIVETFGEPFIFFFGERPRIITVQGILANTFDFNWEAEWWENYDKYIRGTKCVENDARVFLSYDQTLVSGYILGASVQKTSQDPNFVNFAFQMFVVGYTTLSKLGDPNAKQSENSPLGDNNPYKMAYRPKLVPYSGIPTNSADVSQLSLVAGIIRSGLSAVQEVWNTAQNVTKGLQGLTDIGNSLVRVPYGFAGSLVFDDNPRHLPDFGYLHLDQALMKYTTFAANNEEYVGDDRVYASAKHKYGDALWPDPYRALTSGAELIAQATFQWAKEGFTIPPEYYASTISNLGPLNGVEDIVGLTDVGPSRAFLSATASTVGLDAQATSQIPSSTSAAIGNLADSLSGRSLLG